ncbi:uncharacterized protein LOC116260324 [Nymphaea colorata]|nr:uncharacterized protein LOC116260324 [Nymphaea colorata]XP_031494440.1 uncharacterized protein LOC116260324 [Nymphaea colorata]
MLSGVKFIPQGQVEDAEHGLDIDSPLERRAKSRRKDRHGKRKKKSRHDSSDDDELENLKHKSRRKKSWYSSEPSSSSGDENSSFESEGSDVKNRRRKSSRRKRRDKKSQIDVSGEEADGRPRSKSKGKKKEYSSEASLSDSGSGEEGKRCNERKDSKGKGADQGNRENYRKEMGLEWMLRPAHNQEVQRPAQQIDAEEEPALQEEKRPNPRELNPYLKDNGSGYPEEASVEPDQNQFSSVPVVGDGGASWRLKALKRAQEQAAREGRKLDEVVEERWGSLGKMTVSLARNRAAPTHAHLRAIRDRKRGHKENDEQYVDADHTKSHDDKVQNEKRDYLKGISVRNPDMRQPKTHDSLSWRKKDLYKSEEHAELISSAASGLNKFTNDGSFLQSFNLRQPKDAEVIATSATADTTETEKREPHFVSTNFNVNQEYNSTGSHTMSANQLAAKVLQLRMKGKHEEADELLKESERTAEMQKKNDKNTAMSNPNRSGLTQTSIQQKKAEENVDMHLAKKIMQNKQYKSSEAADNEYEYDDVSATKPKKNRKAMHGNNIIKHENLQRRILTQQERCQFCFENPSRPRHLAISIGNLSYLMLPPWKPLVEGHCCILPMQHESSTRNVDDDVWNELRNFKKCLLRMFAEQEKDVIFLETAMELSRQRRHCLVECIPLPHEIAKEAPLYFKKAIDEAEDEWSQHDAKKLIDTSLKGGLRNSIPKNFPYFHVEFGLHKGFVHVIDDETNFKSGLGLDVIRGMLELPEEDMHRRRQYGSLETQKNDVLRFSRDWARFDWTRELD